VNGHGLHYIDEGDGPPLLLLTGGVVWSFIFRDVITRLRSDFRCIAVDLPGAGLSVPATPAWQQTILAHAHVVEAFIDALGLEPVTLVGHDLGGPVGLGVAARRPDLFRAFVFSDMFGFPLDEFADLVAELRRFSGSAAARLNRAFNVVARFTATRAGIGRHLDRAGRKAFLGPYRDRDVRTNGIALLRDALEADAYLQQLERALQTALAAHPVLLVYGEKDPARVAGFPERFRRIFPDAPLEIVAGAHHFPHADDPDAVAAAIRQWWRHDVAPVSAGTAGKEQP
jgi:haloalkane dehalogenase